MKLDGTIMPGTQNKSNLAGMSFDGETTHTRAQSQQHLEGGGNSTLSQETNSTNGQKSYIIKSNSNNKIKVKNKRAMMNTQMNNSNGKERKVNNIDLELDNDDLDLSRISGISQLEGGSKSVTNL